MDPRQLESFVQIATLGGFNRAASHLYLAQSALSRRISQLEHELGVTLLVRTGRGVQLTPAGALLLRKAQVLLRHFRDVREEVRAEADIPRGELLLGMPPSLRVLVTLPLIKRLRSAYPGIFVRTWIKTSIELREMIFAGRLDLAVLGVMETDASLEIEPLFDDPMYLVGWPKAAATRGKTARFANFSEVPLALTSRPNSVRELVETAAAREHAALNVVVEANDVPTLLDLVKSELCYTLLPFSAIHHELRAGEVTAARIDGVSYAWVIASSKEKPLSTTSRLARDLIHDIAGTTRKPGGAKSRAIARDPEKRTPILGKDHAQINMSGTQRDRTIPQPALGRRRRP